MTNYLIDRESVKFRMCNILTNLSYHSPIALQVEEEELAKNYPFKFNQSWLKEESLFKVVREFWPIIQIEERLNVMDSMMKKL